MRTYFVDCKMVDGSTELNVMKHRVESLEAFTMAMTSLPYIRFVYESDGRSRVVNMRNVISMTITYKEEE